MKQYFILGLLCVLTLNSCKNHTSHDESHQHPHKNNKELNSGDVHQHGETKHNESEHGHNHEAEPATEGKNSFHNEHEGHEHDSQEGKETHIKGNHEDHKGHEDGEAHEGEGEHKDEIIISPEKAEEAGISTQKLYPTKFSSIIKCSGTISAAQGNSLNIVAPMSGVISYATKAVEGKAIKKNQTVFIVSSKDIVNGDPIQKNKISYVLAKKEYERLQKLVEDKIVSQKDFLKAKQNYEKAKISYLKTARNHTKNGQQIVSKMNGYLEAILVEEGEYVQAGQVVAVVTKNQKLQLTAEVPEKYYSEMRNIHSANFITSYNDKAFELDSLNGHLISYGKSTSKNSFYIPVTFEFNKNSEVIPGSYADVYLLTREKANSIVLPNEAITEEQGNFFCYIKLDEEGYAKRAIKIGASNGNNVEILSGLHGGEDVVIKGAYSVKLASVSKTIPGHSHNH